MADPNDELRRELDELKNAIGSAADQIRDSNKFGATSTDKAATALRDLGRVAKTTVGGLADAEGNFAAFNSAANSATNMIVRLAGQNTILGSGIGRLAKVVNQVVQATFLYQDSVIKLYDGIGQIGGTTDKTTKDVTKLVQGAGYFIGKHEKFAAGLTEMGSSLTALAPTTSAGASKVATIMNNSGVDNVQLDFMRIGIGPEELNKIQMNYLKISTATGLKLNKNTEEVRESTLQYAISLNRISALTGESRDKIEEQYMASSRDVKFSLKKRQLIASGNEKAARAFDEATAMTGQLGEGVAAGLRDFVASGTATTEEGQALMIKTGGQIKGWVKSVEEGRMTSAELAKNIAKAEARFNRENATALQNSDSFASQMKTTGKSVTNAEKLANMSLDDFNKQMQEQAKTPDKLKQDQSDLADSQRKAGLMQNAIADAAVEPANKALRGLIATVRNVSAFMVKIGIMVTPNGDVKKAMEDFLRIVGDDEDTKNMLAKLNADVDNASKNIQQVDEYQAKINDITTDKAAREKELATMVEKQKRGEAVDRQKMEENRKKILAQSTELQDLEKKKSDVLKNRTEQQLREEQAKAVERRNKASKESFYKTGVEAPPIVEGTEGAVNVYEGLNIKSAETVAGGPVDPKLLELARQIQSSFPGVKFTALNDAYHQKNRPTSKHTKGRALDFSLNPPPKDAKEAAVYKKKLQDMGFAYVADEYFADKGAYTTAGHFHAHIGYADGGIATGPKSGYKATLHGTEAIIPMLDGKTVSIELKNNGTSNDFSSITNAIKAKSMMTSAMTAGAGSGGSDQDSAYTLLGKLESMIASIDESNSTQDKLKMYMRN
jgi:hypothetical protein